MIEKALEKMQKFVVDFNDNFDASIIVFFKMLQCSLKESSEVDTFEIGGKTINSPMKAIAAIVQKLEDLYKNYNVKISMEPPTEEELYSAICDLHTTKANKSSLRQKLVKGGVDIFQSYERELMKLDDDKISIYAKHAANTVLKYFLFEVKSKIFDSDIIPLALCSDFKNCDKGFINCSLDTILSSLLSPALVASIGNNFDKNKRFFFTNVAILSETEGQQLYKTKLTDDLSGYRRLFNSEINTEKICVEYEIENKKPDIYNYVIDPRDIEKHCTKILEYLKERDTDDLENEFLLKISGLKTVIKNELNEINKMYQLKMFEEINELLETITSAIDTKKITKTDEENARANNAPSGAKITSVTQNKIGNWHSTFN